MNTDFEIDGFSVRRISDLGLWLVTTRCQVDLGLLFLRYQEFHESPNKDFVGKKFQLVDYIKWACTKTPKEFSFTYFEQWEGFNVPGDSLDAALKIRWDDGNKYDDLMRSIVENIKQHSEKYYVIGSTSKNASVIDHEIAHGLFYLHDDYRNESTELVADLGAPKWEILDAMRDEGYGDNVLIDEAQAYMSTGLTDALCKFDCLRVPFMQKFAEYRKKLITNA